MNFRWYDFTMNTNKRISNCNSQKIFDCTMDFIVSKMNCSMEWEVQHYPANFPICQSKEDLKKYIELKKSVLNGESGKEIGHCFGEKCQNNYSILDLRMEYDQELLYEYMEIGEQYENTTSLIFTKKNKMVF